MIINGELQTGLGGGVCQVSTTVFNAAFEAGLPITARTNHALYIWHYPLGRDATVNYPDIDLKFVNDTGHWLLLRTFVGSSSLTVALYGTPQHRRVETTAAPLASSRRRRSRRRSTRRSSRARRSSTTRACRRRRPASSARSTRRAASCSPTRPGTRATAPSRSVIRVGPARRRSAEGEEAARRPRPRPRPSDDDDRDAAGAGSGCSALAIASIEPGGHARRPQRRRVDGRVRRPAVGDQRSPLALDRVLVAEPRAAHVDAARVHDAAGRRTAPAAGSGRATRARAPRRRGRAAAGSRPRTARGTRRARPRTRRGSSRCARCPARRSRRSGRGRRSRN